MKKKEVGAYQSFLPCPCHFFFFITSRIRYHFSQNSPCGTVWADTTSLCELSCLHDLWTELVTVPLVLHRGCSADKKGMRVLLSMTQYQMNW